MSYLIDGKFSKTKAKALTLSGSTLKDEMDQIVLHEFKDQSFIRLINNDDSGLLKQAPNGTKLPAKSSGLNDYLNFTYFVCTAAYNRDHTDHTMHKALGFSEDCIRHTTQIEPVHQALMRSKLRVYDSTNPVKAIVADPYVANCLANIIGCATPSKLGDLQVLINSKENNKVKALPLTKTQMNRRSDANRYFNDLGLEELNHEYIGSNDVLMGYQYLNIRDIKHPTETTKEITDQPDCIESRGKKRPVKLAKQIREADQSKANEEFTFSITMHSSIYDTSVEAHRTPSFTLRDFLGRFKKFNSRHISEKKEARLFNPCEFSDFSPNEGFRTKSNFVSASAIVLDFDKGNMSPDMFEQFFWHEASDIDKMSFLICNSFSRSADQPNRFRVIIPLKQPITNINAYGTIVDHLNSRLHELVPEGVTVGLDEQCRNAVQSYYLPCTNRLYPEFGFIRHMD